MTRQSNHCLYEGRRGRRNEIEFCHRPYNGDVKPISTKTKLMLVGAGYAVILAFAGMEYYDRYLYEISHREEVIAYSGMFAGGDLILSIFFALLLMILTLFLIWIGAKFEAPYTIYSKLLLFVGLSAPACLALLYFGSPSLPGTFAVFCFERLFWSPFILAIIAISRVVARFDRAKRSTSYALQLEGGTLYTSIGLILLSMGRANPDTFLIRLTKTTHHRLLRTLVPAVI